MPKFPKNTGFKLPGLNSRELDTPGGFRKDQGVEDVGYCDNTEFNMLPQGSSPLLNVKPEYFKTTYTKTNWPKTDMPKIQMNNKKEDVEGKPESGCPEGYQMVHGTHEGGKCVPIKEDKTKDNDTSISTNTDREMRTVTTPGREKIASQKAIYDTGKSLKGLTQDQLDWRDLEIKKLGGLDNYHKKYGSKRKGTLRKEAVKGQRAKKGSTTIEYYVNGTKVSKAKYDAAGPNQKKEKKSNKGNAA